MNTIHSRGGNQVVFSSINYGTDTSAEGRCIMREILESTYEGVGNGETAIFLSRSEEKRVNHSRRPRPHHDLYQLVLQGDSTSLLPNFQPRCHIQPE